MTNEELAAKIQDGGGEEDLLLLWDQVRRFAASQARRWARASTGMEVEDLLQVGFLALLDALGTWNRDAAMFTTWYTILLKGAFTEAVGLRTARQRNDPLRRGAVSLDAPVGHDADDPLTLLDVLEDPTAERAMQDLMERDFATERSRVLHRLLDQLDETQRQAVLLVHGFGLTVPQAAARLQLDAATVRSAADAGLRILRRPANARQLLGLRT